MKNINHVMKCLCLIFIVASLASGCNTDTKNKRAEINKKIEYFEKKFDVIEEKIVSFNPTLLPFDFAMSKWKVSVVNTTLYQVSLICFTQI